MDLGKPLVAYGDVDVSGLLPKLAAIHRLHVPLVTHLDVGKLYDLNNAVLHAVENKSSVMRIHLTVDMMPHRPARAVYHNSEAAMIKAVGMG